MVLAMQILGAILVFSLLITIHELGHLWGARMFGVKVHEFAIGMGPQIFKWGKGETVYSVRCLPLGGFAQMAEDDGPSDDPRAFVNAKPWKRIIILLGGGIMNLLAGLILCIILVGASPVVTPPVVADFVPGSAIEQAGVPIGAEIVRVNGARMRLQEDVVMETMRLRHPMVEVQYRYNGELRTVGFEAMREVQANGSVRFFLGYMSEPIANSPWYTFRFGSYRFVSISRHILLTLGDLLTGQIDFDQVAGPVGIVRVIGESVGDVARAETAEQATAGALGLTALFLLITINLGLFNLLPFPALDGGRIAFVLLEMVRGKPMKAEHEGTVHFVGFALLMVLVVFATGNDISRIFTGG